MLEIIKLPIVVGISLFFSAFGSSAFDVDGFRSGMTRNQVIARAQEMGLESREGHLKNLEIGRFSENRVDGRFAFCPSDSTLVWYDREIDFDNEFVATLQSFIEKYGQPNRVETTKIPWLGQGGGSSHHAYFTWDTNEDKISLRLTPLGRDGKGEIKYDRGSSVSYFPKNPCSKNF